jgi:hypothetical protein
MGVATRPRALIRSASQRDEPRRRVAALGLPGHGDRVPDAIHAVPEKEAVAHRAKPDLLADLRGEGVEALIARVQAAVAAYPYPDTYRTWPGPNSDTFIAYIGRAVPELRLRLPSTAVGKDYLPDGVPAGITPSGTGVQLSLLGLAGVLVGWDDGVEGNLLRLTFGLDVRRPALKLPGVGRLGVP